MTNHILNSRTAAIAIAFSLAAAAGAAVGADAPRVNGWGVAATDVTPDPAIRFGKLPNGMRYAIMRNATPKGAASVRLNFRFGSIAEKENERGLAHFIEHMAFNGTTNVPEGDMVKILERQGLAFGPDTNAMTGFDATTYMLELPKADSAHLDTAMFLLREVASEVKFDPTAVDRERGVILGERRARDNFQLRQIIDILGFQLPGTPFPNRLPIGTETVLKTASADTIRDLYRRYYRPENATLIFVGDADPADIEARIRKSFGDWKNTTPAGAPLQRGKLDLARPAAFDTFTDPAVATTVSYTVFRPWSDPADTVAERRRKLVDAIAAGMLNRRLQRLVNAPDSALLNGGFMTEDQKELGKMTAIQLVTKDGAWKQGLTSAEQEVRRALQYGFTAAELKTQLASMEASYRTAAEQAATRSSPQLASAILSVVDENDIITTPAYRYERFKEVAASVTPEQVNAAFRELWNGSQPIVHVSSKQPVSNADLASTLAASKAVAVAAPADVATQAFAYDSFGTPGKIVQDRRIADLDVRTVRFANNVRLNMKKTDFEAGRVRFLVRMGNGVLDLPMDKPGLGPMISSMSSLGAVGKHSLEELKELSAGKVLNFGTVVGEDAMVASGATTRADLPLQMKVSAAYLLDPGFRPEAASQWANLIPVFDKQIDAQPQAVAAYRLPIILAAGDQRFGMPSGADLAKRNFDEARAALRPVIADAPIEITVVGDLDEQATINAVAATFGALPQRRLSAEPPAAARKASFRTDRSPIVLKHDGDADQSLVFAAWQTTDDRDFRTEVGMQLLSGVLDLMLTDSIREKLGDSYGVSVQSSMSDVFTDFGYLQVSSIVAPDRAEVVQKAIEEAAAELRDKPIDADLLARARAPQIERIDRARRENGFWIGSLDTAQSKPDRLERVREEKSVLQSITAADLQKLARLYLTPERLHRARVVSSKAAATASR